MARYPPSLLSPSPTAIASTKVFIRHVQLRDLIICPRERGRVNYVQHKSIVEHNLNTPDSTPQLLVKLPFQPNTLSSLPIEGTDDTLLAAGGQRAEIHLSYHSPLSPRHRPNASVWHNEYSIFGDMNNSVLLTSMSLTKSNESSIEPRLCISNNDCTVKLYNVPLRSFPKTVIDEVGCMHLGVAINHSSISPDGRTIISVGDSAKVYLHRMTGGAHITFSPIATLKLPSPTITPMDDTTVSLTASFSTAFSSDGLKFAVASQEGLLAVWDVRSTKPLKIFQTEKSRMPSVNGGVSGWTGDGDGIYDWPGDFEAPGWSVRNVKFGGSGDKELMTFTEHTSLLHVVDARTFETEEIIQVPAFREPSSPIPVPAPAARSQSHLSSPPSYRVHRPSMTNHTHRARSRLNSTTPSVQSTSDSRSRVHVLRALGDTSSSYSAPSTISDSTWRSLRMSDSTATVSHQDGDVEYNDISAISPLRGPIIDNYVTQAFLGSRGFRMRQQSGTSHEEEDDHNTGSTHGDYEYTPRPTYVTVDSRRRHEDDIEVDELESDCVSSRAPSRSSSPSPSTHRPSTTRLASPTLHATGLQDRARLVQPVYPEDLHIAGMCFDPSGRHVYVASMESVVEWSVRGAEKRWWAGSQWR